MGWVCNNFIAGGVVIGAGNNLIPGLKKIVSILENSTELSVKSTHPSALSGSGSRDYADLWLDAESDRLDAARDMLKDELKKRNCRCGNKGPVTDNNENQ
jgi:hypothetical protein